LQPRSARVGAELYALLGIDRKDQKARQAQWARNYEFFGAPVSFFVFTHSGLGEYSVSDAGLFMQNLMLSAHAHGLGTCAQGASAVWADAVRAEFDVPEDYKLLCGIALGYPSDHKVNGFQADRLPISDIKLKTK
jgi:nitroreductase